jgi:predicted transcriptional regulator
MDVVWTAATPVTVRDVVDRLADRRPAYTTVMTVLDRLAGKGVVTRELAGKAWHYSAAMTREQFVAQLMLDVLGQTDSRSATLVHFARAVSAEEAHTLRRALAGEADPH